MDIRHLPGYEVVCNHNLLSKEACDVRTQYSIIFPLSSNQNYQSICFTKRHRISHSGSARYALFARLPWVRSKSLRCTQLGRAHRAGSGYGHSPRMDQMPVPQAVLPAMSRYPYRGSGAFSSVPAGNPTHGPICVSIMPNTDRFRCCSTPESELENGQRH